jgi:hypothetical protein
MRKTSFFKDKPIYNKITAGGVGACPDFTLWAVLANFFPELHDSPACKRVAVVPGVGPLPIPGSIVP